MLLVTWVRPKSRGYLKNMSKFHAVLMVALLNVSLAAWSESPSRAPQRPSAPPAAAAPPGQQVLFQDPMLGTVKMRPVYTRSNRFGAAERPPLTSAVAAVRVDQRPVSVDQTKTVRPGSWR